MIGALWLVAALAWLSLAAPTRHMGAAADMLLGAVGALFTASFVALILVRLCAVLTPRRAARPPPLADEALPTYTIVAPLFREANVLPALIEALDRLDYPRDRLDIKIMLEAGDAETRAVAEDLNLTAPYEVLIAPPGAPQTKPRALNIALAEARGAFITVFDAEDRPHPRQLRSAAEAFAAGPSTLACVQAPLGWWNAHENWLTRQFAIEYAAQFHVVLPALARWGWPLPLGGTSNHFRRAALEACGGWDPFNVTEDADIGYRLAEDGWIADVIDQGTLEEATTGRVAWTLQRSRWIKGFMQTWGVRARRPSALWAGAGWRGWASVHLFLALTVASAFLHGPLAAITGWSVVAHALDLSGPRLGLGALGLVAAGYTASALTGLVGVRRAGLPGLARSLVFAPLYWPLQSWAAVRALRDLITRPYHWQKTRHGATRLVAPGSGVAAR